MPVTAEEKIDRALCELADWAWAQRKSLHEGPNLELSPDHADRIARGSAPTLQRAQRPW